MQNQTDPTAVQIKQLNSALPVVLKQNQLSDLVNELVDTQEWALRASATRWCKEPGRALQDAPHSGCLT